MVPSYCMCFSCCYLVVLDSFGNYSTISQDKDAAFEMQLNLMCAVDKTDVQLSSALNYFDETYPGKNKTKKFVLIHITGNKFSEAQVDLLFMYCVSTSSSRMNWNSNLMLSHVYNDSGLQTNTHLNTCKELMRRGIMPVFHIPTPDIPKSNFASNTKRT